MTRRNGFMIYMELKPMLAKVRLRWCFVYRRAVIVHTLAVGVLAAIVGLWGAREAGCMQMH